MAFAGFVHVPTPMLLLLITLSLNSAFQQQMLTAAGSALGLGPEAGLSGPQASSSGRQQRQQELQAGHKRMRGLARRYDVIAIRTGHHAREVKRSRRAAAGAGEATPEFFMHPEKTSFTVKAFGRRMQLDLQLSTGLVSDKFQMQYVKENGDLGPAEKSVEHCYYHGTVSGAGESDSYAAISTCNGLSGMFGVQPGQSGRSSEAHEDTAYHIEPLVSRPERDGTHLHAVYRARDAKRRNGPQGNHTTSSSPWEDFLRHSEASGTDSSFQSQLVHDVRKRVRRSMASNTKRTPRLYIEMGAILSLSTHKWLLQSTNNHNGFVFNLFNIMNLFLTSNPINVQVVVVRVLTILQEEFDYQANGLTPALVSVRDVFNSMYLSLGHVDTIMFISNRNIGGSEVGVTFRSQICDKQHSVSIVQNFPDDLLLTAVTGVHEIGHQLSFHHTTLNQCDPWRHAQACIMFSGTRFGISPYLHLWSKQSEDQLKNFSMTTGLDCLKNEPSRLQVVPNAVCGNGYVEGSEECDCGSEDDCESVCCNPKTCRLAPGAVCSRGSCCHQCQFRSAGHVCRPAMSGGCDVEERCSGRNNSCPENIYVQSGQSCGSADSPAYCNQGLCRSRDNQCKQQWNLGLPSSGLRELVPMISGGGEDCYSVCLNQTSGLVIGSCPKNACGLLSCKVPFAQGVLPANWVGLVETEMNSKCHVFYEGNNAQALPYLGTDDYTSCGVNSVCSAGRCVSIASLNITSCPLANGIECGGNGVCTTRTTCHCHRGWAGINCTEQVSPATRPTPITGLIAILPWTLLAIVSLSYSPVG